MSSFLSVTATTMEGTVSALARGIASWLQQGDGPLTVALSGGRTPMLLFSMLAEERFRSLPWNRLQVYWVDERWVAMESPESNAGMACRTWTSLVEIAPRQIHPMVTDVVLTGSSEPMIAARAAARTYGQLLRDTLPLAEGIPVFDLVLLGMGADGHTASLFPGGTLETPEAPCTATRHPGTGQIRLSLTLPVINQAKEVVFLVTGKEKKAPLAALQADPDGCGLPVAGVAPVSGNLAWYLDQAAAGQ